MEKHVEIDSGSGFCFGVTAAIRKVFDEKPALVCSDRIEVTQKSNAPCRLCRAQIAQDLFDHVL